MIARRSAVLTALLLAALAPSPVTGAEPLPRCAPGDQPAAFAAYPDWNRTLVDPRYKLPRSYRPPHLVSTKRAGVNAGHEIRQIVVEDLRALARAARRARAPLVVLSGYRSYDTQIVVFNSFAAAAGVREAAESTARSGHSEHQLGTAIDFGTPGARARPWFHDDWGMTRQGRWLARNAWRYGFVMSYPRSAKERTCYSYEPWHWRYVGRDLAARIRDSGLTLREYLWVHGASIPAAQALVPHALEPTPQPPPDKPMPPISPPAPVGPPVEVRVGGVWSIGPADATLAR